MKRNSAWCAGGWQRRWLGAVVAAAALAASCSSGSPPAASDEAGEAEDPNATETNFFTIPCDEDADCAAGRRCVVPREPVDGGPGLGRCVE